LIAVGDQVSGTSDEQEEVGSYNISIGDVSVLICMSLTDRRMLIPGPSPIEHWLNLGYNTALSKEALSDGAKKELESAKLLVPF
jgi:hypothetical protein